MFSGEWHRRPQVNPKNARSEGTLGTGSAGVESVAPRCWETKIAIGCLNCDGVAPERR